MRFLPAELSAKEVIQKPMARAVAMVEGRRRQDFDASRTRTTVHYALFVFDQPVNMLKDWDNGKILVVTSTYNIHA